MLPKMMQLIPLPMAQPQVSRRQFLLGALAVGGGLAVGFNVVTAAPALASETAGDGQHSFSPYVVIDGEGKVTVLSSQFEMGQGSYNGLATLVAEELGADWATIDVVGAAGNVKVYGNLAFGGAIQGTGGSTSMTTSWERYRKAGAAARAMLAAAAAAEWSVNAADGSSPPSAGPAVSRRWCTAAFRWPFWRYRSASASRCRSSSTRPAASASPRPGPAGPRPWRRRSRSARSFRTDATARRSRR